MYKAIYKGFLQPIYTVTGRGPSCMTRHESPNAIEVSAQEPQKPYAAMLQQPMKFKWYSSPISLQYSSLTW